MTQLQTAARCNALVQFGLKEQVSSLQTRLKVQSEELDVAYAAIEQEEHRESNLHADQTTAQDESESLYGAACAEHTATDSDGPEMAEELATVLAEPMHDSEPILREQALG